jgi:hypothetical protein
MLHTNCVYMRVDAAAGVGRVRRGVGIGTAFISGEDGASI